jgi:hypothetical protein
MRILKRLTNEGTDDYKTRVKNTKRTHTLRVTRVLYLSGDEDEEDSISYCSPNEWIGKDRPPCKKRILRVKDIKYKVEEFDVILFLAAITCDMPQRDKTMNRGGTARHVGCAWCLLEVTPLCKCCGIVLNLYYLFPNTLVIISSCNHITSIL